jgi:hypothetical protein
MRLSSTLHEGVSDPADSVRVPDDAAMPQVQARAQEQARLRGAAGEYAELLELFAWQREPAHRRTRAALERAHLESVAGRVNARLPAAVFAELESLPDDSYLAMIRSPEVFHAAFFAEGELGPRLSTWIAVERARLGAATSLDGKVRSASAPCARSSLPPCRPPSPP